MSELIFNVQPMIRPLI